MNDVEDVKQMNANKFIKYIWQMIISTSNATLEVPHYAPVKDCLLKYVNKLHGGCAPGWTACF